MREIKWGQRAHAQMQWDRGAVAVWITMDRSVGGRRTREVYRTAEPVLVDEGQRPPEPTMLLGNQEAVSLMDALWLAGVRPSDGTGSTGQLGATERHLADMRSIAFNRLKMEAGC